MKSDEELCSEIKQFVSLIGLPEGHVPSMKMLSDHGRLFILSLILLGSKNLSCVNDV